MPAEPQAKISSRLSAALAAGSPDGRAVEVVVELEPLAIPAEGSRQERMAVMKQSFQREFESVTRRITEAGGQVLGGAWINRTVRGRVPANKVPVIASDDVVVRIDLPSSLEGEVVSPPAPSGAAEPTAGAS